MNKYAILLVTMIFLAAWAQILLKTSARKQYDSTTREYLNIYVIFAYGLFLISNFFSVYALRGLELKSSAALQGLGYVFIMVLSRLILKEKISRNTIIGNTVIMIGIVVFYQS